MGSFLADTPTALAYVLGNGLDVINVHAVGRDDDDRVVYQYTIFADGALLTSGADLGSGAGATPHVRRGLGALVSFLLADVERFQLGDPHHNGYAFDTRTVAWADTQLAELQDLDLAVNWDHGQE